MPCDPQLALDEVVDRGLQCPGGAEPERVAKVGGQDGGIVGCVDAGPGGHPGAQLRAGIGEDGGHDASRWHGARATVLSDRHSCGSRRICAELVDHVAHRGQPPLQAGRAPLRDEQIPAMPAAGHRDGLIADARQRGKGVAGCSPRPQLDADASGRGDCLGRTVVSAAGGQSADAEDMGGVQAAAAAVRQHDGLRPHRPALLAALRGQRG